MLKTENNNQSSNIDPVKNPLREDGVSWAKASGLRKMFSSPTKKVNSISQADLELEKKVKNFSVLPFVEGFPIGRDLKAEQTVNAAQHPANEKTDTGITSSAKVGSGKATREIIKNRNSLAVPTDEEKPSVQISLASLLNSLYEGISVGVFLETALLALFSSPLLPSTQFDWFLANYPKKLFVSGISLGAIGGLIKACLNTDDCTKLLLVIAAVISIVPTNDKGIENIQALICCYLAIIFLARGFMNTYDSLPNLTKIPEMTKSFTRKIINPITSASFFSKQIENTANEVKDAEACVQPCTTASHSLFQQ